MKNKNEKELLIRLKRHLLNNNFISKEKDPSLFNDISRYSRVLEHFFAEHLRFNLQIGQDFIKLEKFADDSNFKNWMELKIDDKNTFDKKSQYILLCLTLAYFDEIGSNRQFLLNNLVEYLGIQYRQLFDSDLSFEQVENSVGKTNRKALVDILYFLSDKGMLEIVDEEFDNFKSSNDGEALLKTKKNSNFFLHSFHQNLGSLQDKTEIISMNKQKEMQFNVPTNTRLIRKISFSSVIDRNELSQEEIFYLSKKHNRNYIFEFFKENFGCHVEFYDSVILKTTQKQDSFDVFYSNNNSTDKLLLLLLEKVKSDSIKKISVEALRSTLLLLLKDNSKLISAELKKKSNDALLNIILNSISKWGFGSTDNEFVFFNDSILRFNYSMQNENKKEQEILL